MIDDLSEGVGLSVPSSGVPAPDVAARRVRILIVDDEAAICQVLVMAFKEEGFDPIAARSGDAAITILESTHIDVLLVDFRIPDMRGDWIFAYAAATQPHLRRQTLFMTGDITDFAYKLIVACKCNFIRKPFDLGDIVNAMRALSPHVPGHTEASDSW